MTKEYFDVTSDYLKTSKFYNVKDDTYTMVGASGGGAAAEPLSVKRDGNLLVMEIAFVWVYDTRALEPGETRTSDGGIVRPLGTLTVELAENDRVIYRSYHARHQ